MGAARRIILLKSRYMSARSCLLRTGILQLANCCNVLAGRVHILTRTVKSGNNFAACALTLVFSGRRRSPFSRAEYVFWSMLRLRRYDELSRSKLPGSIAWMKVGHF
jgi:hypothetical protein